MRRVGSGVLARGLPCARGAHQRARRQGPKQGQGRGRTPDRVPCCPGRDGRCARQARDRARADPRTPASRAVGARRRRLRRRGGPRRWRRPRDRHRPVHRAVRPGGPRGVAGHHPLRRLPLGRHRRGTGRRLHVLRGGVELAHRRPQRRRGRPSQRRRNGHPHRVHPVRRPGRARAHRRRRDARLLDGGGHRPRPPPGRLARRPRQRGRPAAARGAPPGSLRPRRQRDSLTSVSPVGAPGGRRTRTRQEGGRQLSTEPIPQPDDDAATDDAPEAIPLLAPRDGLTPVIETSTQLVEYAEALRAGTGPVAVDAERASGYRYGQRAYLVQIRRNGSGTGLIDPVPLPDLSVIQDAIGDAEWVLHAANQDLPCLAEIGLVPKRIFDTELAARLAGLPRVGLGAVVESLLGFSLVKGHSAADWSTRPLPEEWLIYAGPDVEGLGDLRDALAAILEEQGKTEWARQEFDAILAAGPPAPKVDPWRKTSGVHGLRNRRQLGMLRALWQARDELARRRDVAPGRVLPDAAIVSAVQADPANEGALLELPVFRGRANRKLVGTWFGARARGRALPETDLPLHSRPGDGPPPVNRWADRDPAAAARLKAARAGLAQVSEQWSVPVENVLSPGRVRRLMWTPPKPADAEAVAEALRAGGAREWQIGLTRDLLTEALAAG